MKIAVMTDSTSYLPQSILEKHHIRTVPLSITLENGQNHKENETIFADEFYSILAESDSIPTTSQPAIGEMIRAYEAYRDEGYTDVIVVHLSSGISGAYQTAIQAADMVEGINVYPFDSKIACLPEGAFALRAIDLIEEGKNVQEILADLEDMRDKTGAYLVVDDLKNLHKSGRITGAQAWIGNLLKMKPVLTFEDGLIVPYEKVRTKKRALKMIEDKALELANQYDNPTIMIIGGDNKEESHRVYKEMVENNPEKNIVFSEFGPVISSHLGLGGFGIGVTDRYVAYSMDEFGIE
ncbi:MULTISPECIES: fatty acid kinase binding subunit FakB1 [unclassified Staphylococcus]|uniref:fatty acid kinase binding subunit FakB1 n=1 Tax=unclassified Staphylococcus TaxID=91994 RepID=UPI0021D1BAFC|nr:MULTISPECIES: fatty acid kinase binding subunit FakB1 [unclassified Staphylococcus]UXR69993.1 fatty acid kinase binding subunit FakB1 [Staphylococcus sp. IVB6246]UXR72033.1 fatty acid kinase binding subunit FakB1 [Staphylococcus sp. IVB6240]UXR74342.1 fatty acid kinase binding subunit FakB1 [Staphylococcus sp. IVB6238]UXR76727.1 fatty acid kinase binding subunit FakB1 [Staphylococcus sp. IVB6233]UXR80856.1 fatty acid kinase binding subunit FakB1 [Staphylococcus sp. IVB6218]